MALTFTTPFHSPDPDIPTNNNDYAGDGNILEAHMYSISWTSLIMQMNMNTLLTPGGCFDIKTIFSIYRDSYHNGKMVLG